MTTNKPRDLNESRVQILGWIKENGPGGWIDNLRNENATLRASLDAALRELVSHREKAQGNYWAWDKDKEENHVESLVCPVMIHPVDLLNVTRDRTRFENALKAISEMSCGDYDHNWTGCCLHEAKHLARHAINPPNETT